MQTSVFPTPQEITDDDLRGVTAVVIDVLRTSSTLIAALAAGAREVIPVRTPAEVGELAARSDRTGTLMGGEREGRPIEGFDLGNSPREYTSEKVGGKVVVFSSTNGAPAIHRVKSAEAVYVAGFNNHSAVVDLLSSENRDVAIICAGRSGRFSIEDFVCAGHLAAGLDSRREQPLSANDAAHASIDLYRRYANLIQQVLRRSSNGRWLIEIGCEQDLSYCAKIDSHNVIPTYIEGKLKGVKPDGSPIQEIAAATA